MKARVLPLLMLATLLPLTACEPGATAFEPTPLSPDAAEASATLTGPPLGAAPIGEPLIAFTKARDASCGPGSRDLGIWVIRPDGSGATCLTGGNLRDSDAAWSPDGTRIAFHRLHFDGSFQDDIFVMNADGSGLTRLTFHRGSDASPTWSPDGTRIAFVTNRENVDVRGRLGSPVSIWQVDLTTGVVSKIVRLKKKISDPAWSPDGDRIAFTAHGNVIAGESDVWALDFSLGVVPLTSDLRGNRRPEWSPDGSRIAFASRRDDPAGHLDIYAMDGDGSNVQRLTDSPLNENAPDWSPDGTQITFMRQTVGTLYDVMVMDADGTDVISISESQNPDFGGPNWGGPAGGPPDINEAPVADPGGGYTGVEGSAVAFDGSASSDPDGDDLSFVWTFGDGGSATGPTPSHTYADDSGAGSFLVELTVDDGELSHTAETTATVVNVAPTVSLAGEGGTVVAGRPFGVTGAFADPGVLDAPWSWTIVWPGGTTSGETGDQAAAITGSVTFCEVGTHAVTLTVTDKDGGAGSDQISVLVTGVQPRVTLDPAAISSNPRGGGVLTLTIFGADDLDVAAIDPATVTLGDGDGDDPGVRAVGRDRLKAEIEDVDGDGHADLVVQFDRRDLMTGGDLHDGTTELTLSAALPGGCGGVSVKIPVRVVP